MDSPPTPPYIDRCSFFLVATKKQSFFRLTELQFLRRCSGSSNQPTNLPTHSVGRVRPVILNKSSLLGSPVFVRLKSEQFLFIFCENQRLVFETGEDGAEDQRRGGGGRGRGRRGRGSGTSVGNQSWATQKPQRFPLQYPWVTL